MNAIYFNCFRIRKHLKHIDVNYIFSRVRECTFLNAVEY